MAEEKNYYPGIDYQGLFNHMSEEHGLTLTESEMQEIALLCQPILPEKPPKKVSCSVCPKAPGMDTNKNCSKCKSKIYA